MQDILASLLAMKDIPTQVSESEWMDAATQERAAKKADQMLQLIGYPDWLTDPSKVILMTMMVMVMMRMTIVNTSQVDEYYLTAPETSEQDHFMNMVSTGHWAAIQDLKTLRWEIIFIKPFHHLHNDHCPGRSQIETFG